MTDYYSTVSGNLLWFGTLCPDGAFALAFRIDDEPDDPWTSRVNRVKFPPQGTSLRSKEAAAAVLVEALNGKITSPNGLGVVSVLGHNDTATRTGNYLAFIGQAVAQGHGLAWMPDLLTKVKTGELKRAGSPSSRREMIRGAYSAQPCPGFTRIMVLDDFSTSGATLQEISRAIKTANPAVKVKGLILGKHENKAYWKWKGRVISNGHLPSGLADLWDQTEGS